MPSGRGLTKTDNQVIGFVSNIEYAKIMRARGFYS